MYLKIFNILIFLLIYSCNNPENKKENENKIVIPERIFIELSAGSNVLADFDKAIKLEDFRFVGVMGYSLVVPGITNYYGNYDKSNGVKIIKGTSDSFSYKDPIALKNAIFFKNYALTYNKLLLKYLSKKLDA